MDKEKSKKKKGVKHVAFANDKVKEETTPPNYKKLKPPALGWKWTNEAFKLFTRKDEQKVLFYKGKNDEDI